MKIHAVILSILLMLSTGSLTFGHSPHDNIKNIAISPNFETDRTIFCTITHVNCHILKSTDGGGTWNPSQIGYGHYKPFDLELSPAFAADGMVFLATEEGGVYRSDDYGTSWTATNTGLTDLDVFALAVSPAFANDQTVFAGTIDSGVFKSTNAGNSWKSSHRGMTEPGIIAIGFSPDFASDRYVLAATREHGIFRSTDGGEHWRLSNAGLEDQTRQTTIHYFEFGFSPAFDHDDTVFVATWQRVLRINRFDDESAFVAYSGNWEHYVDILTNGPGMSYSSEPGAKVDFEFRGGSIKWIGAVSSQGGIANVYIDGVMLESVDLYAPQIEMQKVLFARSGHITGDHKITIEVTGNKNSSSLGTAVFVDAFEFGY